jgi:deoxycytidylate deaminase
VGKKAIAPYKGHDLYVFRFRPMADGTWLPCNSQPCRNCTEKIKKAGIKNVYYSESIVNPDGSYGFKIVKVKAKDLKTEHVSFGNRFKTDKKR